MATNFNPKMILVSISSILKTNYPTYPIYIEEQEQYATLPCFFITISGLAINPQLDNNYRYTYNVSIYFLCKNDDSKKQEQFILVGDKLAEILQQINIPLDDGSNFIRNTQDINIQYLEDRMIFSCNYKFLLKKEMPPVEKIQDIDVDVKIKEE